MQKNRLKPDYQKINQPIEDKYYRLSKMQNDS